MSGMKSKTVYIDTNIFIYFFQSHDAFGPAAKAIFEKVASGKWNAVTSVLTLSELLSIATQTEAKLIQTLYFETPHLVTIDVDMTIASEAARIRREYHFRLPDAIHLATALYANADMFVTNDKRLRSFKEIDIQFL